MNAVASSLRNPRVAFGALVLLAIVAAAAGAPWLSGHDPLEQDLLNSFQRPGSPAAITRIRSAPTASAATFWRG